jgi:hypothetical protein
MKQTVSEPRREAGRGGRLEPSREGGVAVSLWLLAAVMAEGELLLWLLDRSYGS